MIDSECRNVQNKIKIQINHSIRTTLRWTIFTLELPPSPFTHRAIKSISHFTRLDFATTSSVFCSVLFAEDLCAPLKIVRFNNKTLPCRYKIIFLWSLRTNVCHSLVCALCGVAVSVRSSATKTTSDRLLSRNECAASESSNAQWNSRCVRLQSKSQFSICGVDWFCWQ